MKIKHFFIATVLITAVFCSGGTASAVDNSALIAQLQAQIAALQAQLQQMLAQQGAGPTWCHTFNTNLGYPNSGSLEVGYLHIALYKENISYSPDTINAYSEPTMYAVKQFQARYGITQTGYVGPLTRAKLNTLYGCNQPIPPTPPTPPVVTPINGSCGTAVRTYTSTESFPTSYTYCSAGTVSISSAYLSYTAGSTTSWTCIGSNGGANTTCTATRAATTANPVNGSCGTAVRTYTSTESFPASYTYCSAGTVSISSAYLSYTAGSTTSWTCIGSNGGANTTCTATRAATTANPVNGSCGTATRTFSQSESFPGNYTHCYAGTASPGSPYLSTTDGSTAQWICLGTNGGVNSSTCTATRTAATATPINGACGTAVRTYTSTESFPASYTYCSAGTASPSSPSLSSIAGSSTSWICVGTNGGANSSTCTATRAATIVTPVNGVCGTAAKSYLSTDTTFSGTMCSAGSGTTTPANPSFPAQGGSTTWTCGGLNGGVSSPTCTATRAEPVQPTITVTFPNGGEAWKVGEARRITWNSNGVDNVRIYIYDSSIYGSGSTNYITPNNNYVPASQGYYDWTIQQSQLPGGNTLPRNYKIRIDSMDNGENVLVSDSSNNYFTVTAAATAVNGVCGTAVRTYASTESFPGSYTYCALGTPNPSNPVLDIAAGADVSWTCLGTNGGANATCVATRFTAVSSPAVMLYALAGDRREENGVFISCSRDFFMYTSANNSWVRKASFPEDICSYSSSVYANGYIYVFNAEPYNSEYSFYRYSILDDVWEKRKELMGARSPASVYTNGDYIYALREGGSFWRYSISGNSWLRLADNPDYSNQGLSMTYSGSGNLIYALNGSYTKNFYTYNINTNVWTKINDIPEEAVLGASLTSAGIHIYALVGGVSGEYQSYDYLNKSFYQYNPTLRIWAKKADIPYPSLYGSNILAYAGGDYIFALPAHGTDKFYRYSISNNAWTERASLPVTASAGASLVSVPFFPPNSPTNLTANAVSSSQINISWTAPASDGGNPIRGYKIERASPVGGTWSTIVPNTGNTNTTYQDAGLTPGTQYNYRVSAINAIGAGNPSNESNATTTAPTAQRLPTESYILQNSLASISNALARIAAEIQAMLRQ